MRLGILTTHPVQYHASFFRALARHPSIDLEVFYCHRATKKEQADAGFGVEFEWDQPLTEGYPNRFLANIAREPQVNSFHGLDTPGIREILAAGSFDALMINGWHYKSAWQAMRACWKFGLPLMAKSDSHLLTDRSMTKKTVKWPLYRWFIPKLDACLAAGRWSSDYFLHYGADPERVFVVPHVVDTDYFRQQAQLLQPSRDELRSKWKLPAKSTVFLFAGKFTELKRPTDFVMAIREATKTNRSIVGLMVGDGPERQRCEQLVKQEGLPISFTGFLNQSEIASAYVAADMLVVTSETETWGLVVNEGMACDLPCIISNRVGCGPDMIVHGETGFTFPAGDISALTTLLTTIADNPARLNEMRFDAHRKGEQYSLKRGVEATLVAAESVVMGQRK